MLSGWFGAWQALAAKPLAGVDLPLPFALPGLERPSAAIPLARLQQIQADYVRDCSALWQQAASGDATALELNDRRFKDDAWRKTPGSAFGAAWYLLNARYLKLLADGLDGDAKTRERLRFLVEQFVAAASPSNYLALNPEAQAALVESRGESLRRGLSNMLADLGRGKISQSDETGFVLGKNLATTAGSVVFENDLIQLLQFEPRTKTVHERALLIVPPCINKILHPRSATREFAGRSRGRGGSSSVRDLVA